MVSARAGKNPHSVIFIKNFNFDSFTRQKVRACERQATTKLIFRCCFIFIIYSEKLQSQKITARMKWMRGSNSLRIMLKKRADSILTIFLSSRWNWRKSGWKVAEEELADSLEENQLVMESSISSTGESTSFISTASPDSIFSRLYFVRRFWNQTFTWKKLLLEKWL